MKAKWLKCMNSMVFGSHWDWEDCKYGGRVVWFDLDLLLNVPSNLCSHPQHVKPSPQPKLCWLIQFPLRTCKSKVTQSIDTPEIKIRMECVSSFNKTAFESLFLYSHPSNRPRRGWIQISCSCYADCRTRRRHTKKLIKILDGKKCFCVDWEGKSERNANPQKKFAWSERNSRWNRFFSGRKRMQKLRQIDSKM